MKTLSLIIGFALISYNLFAEIISPEWLAAEHGYAQVSQSETIPYPYARLQRRDTTPIILLHGIGGNHHNYMDLATELYKMGHDVWAFSWYSRNDRNMDGLGTLTVPSIVNFVTAKTGRKALLVGHSLGGIISKIYIFGLTKKPDTNTYVINRRLKRNARKNLLGFISIASPNGLENESIEDFLPFFENLPVSEPFGTENLTNLILEKRVEKDIPIAKLYEFNSISLRLPGFRSVIKAVYHMPYHPYEDYNIGKTFRYGFSEIPKPLRDQVRSISQNSNPNDQAGLYYTDTFLNDQPLIPIAYISAENDAIGGRSSIEREARSQKALYLELPQAGHLDPLIGDMRFETASFINRFLLKVKK